MPSVFASLVLQQEVSPVGGLASFLVMLAAYLYFAYCLVVIAQKTNTEPAWWGWVPILNAFLLLKIAGRPLWWFLLYFIPVVNFIIAVVVFVDVCKARNKNSWLAVGFFLPLVNFVVLGYLAFSD